jgi:hypothetical protein
VWNVLLLLGRQSKAKLDRLLTSPDARVKRIESFKRGEPGVVHEDICEANYESEAFYASLETGLNQIETLRI